MENKTKIDFNAIKTYVEMRDQSESYLEQVIFQFGYEELVGEDSNKNFKTYAHPCGDKILLSDLKGGRYCYFRNVDILKDSGDMFDFILHRLKGVSVIDINATVENRGTELLEKLLNLNLPSILFAKNNLKLERTVIDFNAIKLYLELRKRISPSLELVVQRHDYKIVKEESNKDFRIYAHPLGDKILTSYTEEEKRWHFRNMDLSQDYGDTLDFILHRLDGVPNINEDASLQSDATRLVDKLSTLNIFASLPQTNTNQNMKRVVIDFNAIKPYLEQVVQGYGYEIDNDKSCKGFRKYIHPSGDKILLSDLRGGGYCYFRNVDIPQDYGDITTFILHRLKGAAFIDTNATLKSDRTKLIEELSNLNLLSSLPQVADNVNHQRVVAKEVFNLKRYDTNEINTVDERALNILSRRGIDIDIRQNEFKNSFKVILSKEKKHPSLLFTWIDSNKRVVGGQYKYYDGDKCVKRFLANTDRANSLWRTEEDGKDAILITEDPIDALSHKQLYPDKNYSYICTGGSIAYTQLNLIKTIVEESKLRVVLGMDNDEKGQQMNGQLLKYLTEGDSGMEKKSVTVEIPVLKDWNEQLRDNLDIKKNVKLSI